MRYKLTLFAIVRNTILSESLITICYLILSLNDPYIPSSNSAGVNVVCAYRIPKYLKAKYQLPGTKEAGRYSEDSELMGLG